MKNKTSDKVQDEITLKNGPLTRELHFSIADVSNIVKNLVGKLQNGLFFSFFLHVDCRFSATWRRCNIVPAIRWQIFLQFLLFDGNFFLHFNIRLLVHCVADCSWMALKTFFISYNCSNSCTQILPSRVNGASEVSSAFPLQKFLHSLENGPTFICISISEVPALRICPNVYMALQFSTLNSFNHLQMALMIFISNFRKFLHSESAVTCKWSFQRERGEWTRKLHPWYAIFFLFFFAGDDDAIHTCQDPHLAPEWLIGCHFEEGNGNARKKKSILGSEDTFWSK